jgi:tRNA 2-thiocytidine biosynthesis protein TtcA
MPPKLLSDDGRHVVIRPLAYCSEEDIARYAEERRFPIIPCNLCGSQPNLQRQAIKEMLRGWKQKHPGRIENIFRAIANVSPSQLADRELFDFINLEQGRPWTEENSSKPQAPPDWLAPRDSSPHAAANPEPLTAQTRRP